MTFNGLEGIFVHYQGHQAGRFPSFPIKSGAEENHPTYARKASAETMTMEGRLLRLWPGEGEAVKPCTMCKARKQHESR